MIDDYLPGATITKFFATTAATTAPTTFAGTPAIAVLKDGTLTPSTAGVTLTVDVDTGGGAVTGFNRLQINTAADTNFYSSGIGGSKFTAFVTAGTVDGVSRVGYVVYEFRLGALIPYDLPTRTDLLVTNGLITTAETSVLADLALVRMNTDNLPSAVKKNTALNAFPFFMVRSTDHVTGATGLAVTAERSLDGGAFAPTTNAPTEIANGIYIINLSAADLNANTVALRFTASNADPRIVTLVTKP